MAMLRPKLRVVAAVWLMFQAASLTALLPRDCCAAHRPADANRQESTSATYCPMRDADGRPCAMHRGPSDRDSHQSATAEHHSDAAPSAHHHQAATPQQDRQPLPPAGCRLTGACSGPMAALALLSYHGILPESIPVTRDAAVRVVTTVAHDHVGGRFQPPDPPPPRA